MKALSKSHFLRLKKNQFKKTSLKGKIKSKYSEECVYFMLLARKEDFTSANDRVISFWTLSARE